MFLRLRPAHDFQPDAKLPGVLTVTDRDGTETYLQLVATPGAVALPAQATATPAWQGGVPRLLGLALLGGLMLNLMPCVFPVLALKTAGLAGLAGARRRQAAAHAASYAAGVLSAFAVLAGALLVARAAGAAAGWGFQFQHPGFVAAIAWVLFAVGLNLSGVFSLGGSFAGAGQSLAAREGHGGSFATGLLAVVVATPCTAPFMGAAIAGALAAPPAAALAVFLAMGLGMAAPYVVLALIPGVARALPRPGAWMEVLRQALAFPMYGAAAWLVWVMSEEAGSQGVLATLAGAVLIGLGAWALGLAERAEGRGRRLGRAVAGAALLAALAVLPGIGLAPVPQARARGRGRRGVLAGAAVGAGRCRPAGVRRCHGGVVHHLQGQRAAGADAARARRLRRRRHRLSDRRLDAAGPGDLGVPAHARACGRAALCVLSGPRSRAGGAAATADRGDGAGRDRRAGQLSGPGRRSVIDKRRRHKLCIDTERSPPW